MADLAVRERILAALFARLQARLQPAGDGQAAVSCRRNPGAPQDQRAAVDQYDGGHDVTYASDTGHSLFGLQVDLMLFSPDGPELNELYARVRDAIDLDSTLGELADDTRELRLAEPVPGNVPGHADIVAAPLTILIEFRTRDGNVRALN